MKLCYNCNEFFKENHLVKVFENEHRSITVCQSCFLKMQEEGLIFQCDNCLKDFFTKINFYENGDQKTCEYCID